MLKAIITGAVISQGYENSPALKFSEKGDAVQFRVGKKVYDPKEDGGHRWVNLRVKAFGPLCGRLQKMKLQAGSAVNLLGRLDEEEWTDKAGEKHSHMVIVLDEIEYASGSGPKKERREEPEPAARPAVPQAGGAEEPFFAGYEPFGGPNPFFGD